MNAIAGVVYPDAYQTRPFLEPMLSSMAHRGPTFEDTYHYRHIHLGCRGSKVWVNEKQTLRIIHDAHICNTVEITQTLKTKGYRFKTSELGEVLAAAYDHWGMAFVSELEGEFSLAILDQQNNQLLLYRDRIGKKPLYWIHDAGHLLFASELKALLCTGFVPQSPSPEGFAAYLYFGYLPQDLTPIAKVNKLLPGYYLQYNLDGRISIHHYWSCSDSFAQPVSDRGEALVATINERLNSSTQRCLPKNGKVGTWVSGGLGSACTAHHLASNADHDRIVGYTATFHGQNDQDYEAAHQVAHKLKITHRHHAIETEDILRQLVSQVWYLDEPIGNPNISNVWSLAAMTAQDNVNTVFSGMGADELLGEAHCIGENDQDSMTLVRKLAKLSPSWRRYAIEPLLGLVHPAFNNRMRRHVRIDDQAWTFMQASAVFSERELKQVSPTLTRFFEPEIFLQRFYRMVKISSALGTSQYFDLKTRLPDALLAPFDRITTLHGLTWNTPFLDHKLVEYLIGVAASASTGSENPTWHFRQSVRNTFPGTVLHRPKDVRDYFLLPWTRTDSMHQVLNHLRDGSLVESGLVAPRWIQRHLEQPSLSPKVFHQLWTLLVLEIWFRLFINNPSRTEPPKIWVRELLRTRP